MLLFKLQAVVSFGPHISHTYVVRSGGPFIGRNKQWGRMDTMPQQASVDKPPARRPQLTQLAEHLAKTFARVCEPVSLTKRARGYYILH